MVDRRLSGGTSYCPALAATSMGLIHWTLCSCHWGDTAQFAAVLKAKCPSCWNDSHVLSPLQDSTADLKFLMSSSDWRSLAHMLDAQAARQPGNVSSRFELGVRFPNSHEKCPLDRVSAFQELILLPKSEIHINDDNIRSIGVCIPLQQIFAFTLLDIMLGHGARSCFWNCEWK